MQRNAEAAVSASDHLTREEIWVAFEKRLSGLLDASVGPPLPRLDELLPHDGNPLREQDVHCYVLQSGICLSSGLLEQFRLATGETLPNRFELVEQANRSWTEIGKRDSHHEVQFATLRLHGRNTDDVNGEESLALDVGVAIKPYPFRQARYVLQECALMQYLANHEPRLPSHELLGLVVDDEAQLLYMLTRFQPQLHSVDSYDWSALRDQPETVDERLRPVIATLVMAHTASIFLNDPAFRNIVEGDEAGSVYLVDLESAVSHLETVQSTRGDALPEALVRAMGKDFSMVQSSFGDFVYPNLPADMRPKNGPEGDVDRLRYELAHLFEPYQAALERHNVPYRALLLRVLDEVMRRKREGAGLAAKRADTDTTTSVAL